MRTVSARLYVPALLLLGYKPGAQVAITIARGSERINAQVTLGTP